MANTRFRAYQLGEEGSSFSYAHDGKLLLGEARFTDTSAANVDAEIRDYGGGNLDRLHITSWDVDHCNLEQLKAILAKLKPRLVEAPGYSPHTETGKQCEAVLGQYTAGRCVSWSPPTISSLDAGQKLKRNDIVLWPKSIAKDSNDNSTAKLFRAGHFTVLSLGDLEDAAISAEIAAGEIVRAETDVMTLPHHGADNGFLTTAFMEAVRPSVAVCTSNYDNQYTHPRQAVRDILYKYDVPIFTTKTGDVIIESIPDSKGKYAVTNLISDSTKVSTRKTFQAKTY